MIVVTGATGKLGRLVVENLLTRVPAREVAVAVRDPAKAAALAARGVDVRAADYGRPETFARAFAQGDRVLLISSNAMGERVAHHRVVVEAAQRARVALLAYTSILHADTSPMALAREHLETERRIRATGVPFVFLRNGWYIENASESLAPALAHGAIVGSAGDGRIAAATRADYAAAAAVVLTGAGHENRIYELAGDAAYTMGEVAAAVTHASGKQVRYRSLPAPAYAEMLRGFGLPPLLAETLADADAHAAHGALDDHGGALHQLIGRATTPMPQVVAAALAAAP